MIVFHESVIDFDSCFNGENIMLDELIDSDQIASELGITRHRVNNSIKAGYLPDPLAIESQYVYYWRKEQLQPYLDRWKEILDNASKV